jgi:hypothetical protein
VESQIRSRHFSEHQTWPFMFCLLPVYSICTHSGHMNLNTTLTHPAATSTSTPSRVAWSTPTTRSKRINYILRGVSFFFFFLAQTSKARLVSIVKPVTFALFCFLNKKCKFIVLCSFLSHVSRIHHFGHQGLCFPTRRSSREG